MKKAIDILLLEDNSYDAELTHNQLIKSELIFNWLHVSKLVDFKSALINFKPEVILSDYNLIGFTALDALNYAKEICPLVPIIIVTGTLSDETAVDTIKQGASDYVVKERLARLPLAIKNALELTQEKSERRKAEMHALKLSMAIEQSPESIIITDTNGVIEYVNSKFVELSGYTFEESIGNKPGMLQSGQHTKLFYQKLWKTISSGKTWKGEFLNKKKDGTLYWENASIAPLTNGNQVITNYVAIKEDVTEKKKILTDLKKAKEKAEESDRLKTAFLANMSHEIRTPMNGILGFTSLLKEPDLTGSLQQEYIRIIEKSGVRMMNTINDIVDISKLESGQVNISNTKFDLIQHLNELLKFFSLQASEKKISLKLNVQVESQQLFINTDKEKLTSILSNLVKNAIKYTHKGTVEFGCILTNNESNPLLDFYVKDTGIGIPEHKLIDIFHRFVQITNNDQYIYEGSGLGLTISKAYVEMLGGQINVESKEHHGSYFRFSLPYFTDN